ncbi:xanthine dehydrogenase family protein subunit M [uncultured Anaeromusa sp.]|uniref:FAD binding domain-containing protein n=1 Tax=uncultured Anaeromusa sp. TaxID=673273 RepID=UPI0029C634B9|nr:xanthine dehydrogenase family protein subunit M [uncultured Anaeromusa sp.]
MASFQYVRAASIDEACQLAARTPGYIWLAGGTDFMVQLRLKRRHPSLVIDVGRLEELRRIRLQDGKLSIGAAVTHTELVRSELVQRYAPALAQAARQVGSPQIRNRGTVGGNMGNASPAADTVPALLAYGTEAVLASAAGRRRLPLSELAVGPGRLALKESELIHEFLLAPQQSDEGACFQKIGKRKALAISVVNGAAWLKLSGDVVQKARLAMGSVAAKTIRLYEAEAVLTNQSLSFAKIEEAAELARQIIHPIDDVRSEAAYRKNVAFVVVKRALEEAWRQAKEGAS